MPISTRCSACTGSGTRALELDALERRVVGGHRRDVVVVEPVDALHRRSRVGRGVPLPVAGQEPRHRARAEEHDVAGLDRDPAHLAGRVQVGARERGTGLHDVDALEPGDVEQHTARHQRLHEADAALAGASRGDGVRGVTVPQVPAVAGVRERVPVGTRLERQVHRVVGEPGPVGVTDGDLVDLEHLVDRVVAARDEADLRPVVVERDRQREGLAALHARGAPLDRGGVDEVERSQLVVVAPAAPIADTPGHRQEVVVERHSFPPVDELDQWSSGNRSMRMALPRAILYTVSSSRSATCSSNSFFVCGQVESVCG